MRTKLFVVTRNEEQFRRFCAEYEQCPNTGVFARLWRAQSLIGIPRGMPVYYVDTPDVTTPASLAQVMQVMQEREMVIIQKSQIGELLVNDVEDKP